MLVYCTGIMYSISVKSRICLSSIPGEAQLHDIDCVFLALNVWVSQSPYANSTSSLQDWPEAMIPK